MAIIKVSDLLEQMFEAHEDDKKIYVEDGHLVLNYDYEYNIALDRISTPAEVLGWVNHLADKTWMTKERIQNFIKKCGEANNTNYFCG